ncbi:hypothetical protein STSP2_00165 [Anaerohalosphaera lusitana]|uniref:Uncharacterized protein n=1 Tax=Anaerohalosphaera lusitana TaxID=1936003 RepID=A0A1U9NGY1_9BACT|nr:hypothetical protein STSP2_00165 [Anaerohalosphaera lusitana]
MHPREHGAKIKAAPWMTIGSNLCTNKCCIDFLNNTFSAEYSFCQYLILPVEAFFTVETVFLSKS